MRNICQSVPSKAGDWRWADWFSLNQSCVVVWVYKEPPILVLNLLQNQRTVDPSSLENCWSLSVVSKTLNNRQWTDSCFEWLFQFLQILRTVVIYQNWVFGFFRTMVMNPKTRRPNDNCPSSLSGSISNNPPNTELNHDSIKCLMNNKGVLGSLKITKLWWWNIFIKPWMQHCFSRFYRLKEEPLLHILVAYYFIIW